MYAKFINADNARLMADDILDISPINGKRFEDRNSDIMVFGNIEISIVEYKTIADNTLYPVEQLDDGSFVLLLEKLPFIGSIPEDLGTITFL